MFFMFIAFEGFYSQSCGFDGKNYPKVCLRGVFISKIRTERSSKAFKRVYLCFFS